MNIRKTGVVAGVWMCLWGMPWLCFGQQKSQAPAETSRAKAQEKLAVVPATRVVWTNDNLPSGPMVSVVGKAPSSPTTQGTGDADPQTTADPADMSSDRDKVAADLAAAKKDLASAKTDLNIAQREYKLDSDQFYSSPDYASNQQGQAKLDSDKREVAAKQQAVDAAQKKVDDLQKKLDELNAKLKAKAPAPKS